MSSALPAPETPAAPPSSFLADLGDVLLAPGEAFARIAAHKRFLPALLASVALAFLFTAIWVSKADLRVFMRTQLEEQGVADKVTPEVFEQQVKFARVTVWLSPLVFTPSILVAMAAVFLFVYRFFLGAELEVRQSVAVVAWTFLAYSLVTIPLALLVFALKGDWSLHPGQILQANPAALLDRATTSRALYAFAETFDLFVLWMLALLSLGFAAATRLPVRTAAWGVLGPWIVLVVLKVGLAAVFSAMR